MPKVSLSELGLSPDAVKPGDELTFSVAKVEGDEAELSYSPDTDSEDDTKPEDMTPEMAQKMPLDKLESKLPKADR